MNNLTYLLSVGKKVSWVMNLAVLGLFTLSTSSCSEDGSESHVQPAAVSAPNDLAIGESITLISKASTVHSYQMSVSRISPSNVHVMSSATPATPDHRATSYAIDLFPNAAGQIVIPNTGKWWWIPFNPSEPPVQMIKGTVWTVSCDCEQGIGDCAFESKSENIFEGSCAPNPIGEHSPECECCSTTWTRVDYLGTHGPGVLCEAINLTYNSVVYN